ncbi:hypothetical protein CDAR_299641 [Caerostris darwini]|uniref:Uncharacterized protein n=1 Tax=Caerostris darwini TaxID=1538125 RepID=A0AAV4RQW4_9ARAC|nr:hypothetical protein CDAR_299641 [Caerostris darwini]
MCVGLQIGRLYSPATLIDPLGKAVGVKTKSKVDGRSRRRRPLQNSVWWRLNFTNLNKRKEGRQRRKRVGKNLEGPFTGRHFWLLTLFSSVIGALSGRPGSVRDA